jgi:hypothetical protein
MSDESLSLEVGENLGRLEQLRARNAELRRALAATESSAFSKLGTLVRRLLKR